MNWRNPFRRLAFDLKRFIPQMRGAIFGIAVVALTLVNFVLSQMLIARVC